MRSSFSIHNVYGDHMVLQRGKPIRIAGTATPGLGITGFFLGHEATAVADADGEWIVEFPPANSGGPYTLSVECDCSAQSRIELHDILVGDVWFCSGQSNMAYPVWSPHPFERLKDGEAIAAAANDDRLRLLQVPWGVDPDTPCTEAPGRPAWMPATTPEAVKPFSAVGYWFGRRLRETVGGDVPIGIVNSSWGGTLIEPWIPEDAYARAGRKGELAVVAIARDLFVRRDEMSALIGDARRALADWLGNKFFATDPAATADALARWASPEFVPGAEWERGPLDRLDTIAAPGVFWLRREFTLPESCAGRPAVLSIAKVDDSDETFVDGARIGATGIETPQYWAVQRQYPFTVPETAGGRHILAVRVIDHFRSGFLLPPVTLSVDGLDESLDLAGGEWARRVEFMADTDAIGLRPPAPDEMGGARASCQTPTTLYNAMVHPFTVMNICGVAWYQGCSNSWVDPGNEYLALSRLWIGAWRRAWRDEGLPFLVTQLASFAEHHPETRLPDDFWRDDTPDSRPGFAPLRETQERFAAEERQVGLACTIDIGDHSDIHPANKRDVGLRLAHEALRIAYGRADAMPGPCLDTATSEGGALRIRFRNVGAGLEAAGGIGPHLFALAGSDRKFAWAKARLDADNTVVVDCDEVPEPRFVRYAWSAYPPNVTLRRKGDGLPVLPFRFGPTSQR